MRPTHDPKDSLANRREFIKKAILGTGVAFGAPAIVSVVRPADLSAQASGGGGGGGPSGPSGPAGGSGGSGRRGSGRR